MSIDDKISAIKQRIDSARIAKARADVGLEAATKQIDEGMTQLKAVFGVDSQEQARAKMLELQGDIDQKMAEITAILDKHKL